jgi:hypothetical protein
MHERTPWQWQWDLLGGIKPPAVLAPNECAHIPGAGRLFIFALNESFIKLADDDINLLISDNTGMHGYLTTINGISPTAE